MLRRHTGMRIPPGHIVYGLETYQNIWCRRAEKLTFGWKPAAHALQAGIRFAAGTIIGRTLQHSQGLYAGGWAARVLRYMLPPGGSTLLIEGRLPEWKALAGQTLRIDAGGYCLSEARVPRGNFRLAVEVPDELRGDHSPLDDPGFAGMRLRPHPAIRGKKAGGLPSRTDSLGGAGRCGDAAGILGCRGVWKPLRSA